MVKVIKYGQKRRVTCEVCGALLEFEKDDVKTVQMGMNEYEQQIECPACNETVKINQDFRQNRRKGHIMSDCARNMEVAPLTMEQFEVLNKKKLYAGRRKQKAEKRYKRISTGNCEYVP